MFGVAGMARCYMAPGSFVGGRAIEIGEGSFINIGCFFDLSERISIGALVRVGMRTMFITGTHVLSEEVQRAGCETAMPITVGDGCWIGANCTILPGVNIGRGAVVAAGSVVTRSVGENEIHAGVPAKLVRVL